ncbi:MAG: phosphate/phosphite/phosphonate ABC transporter substrate-binding protein [Dechloromonas sp.]|uniref:Phosphate/phosphite/phosphonate ABC transporter substrate-binding protein n=1 Tax=Candidatus Dechloromonas phosphorivorans TaxID=2899244 RepID=A0A935JVS1_9RHOO|nr:phosphate/phosphite/phosphonate ABC transporter substrate-binding protein [Candidatus Dechloromonas phosphorivorans]
MNSWRTGWRALLLCCGLMGLATAQPEPLRIGIIPYLTPNVLMSLFQPLRQHLEKDLGRPVELYTATDVRSFARRTLKPDFDIVITAAHQARLAQLEGGYHPLARFTGPLHAAVIVAQKSPLNQIKDLRGRRIAITDRSILVNIAMNKVFADQGLSDKDFDFVTVNSQNTAIIAVAQGDSDAAIIAHFTLDQSPEDQRRAVRVIYRSDILPNVLLLASAKRDDPMREQIRASLLGLPGSPDGAAFLEKSRFQGIQKTDEAFMKTLDPYLKETRKQLGL